jgi:hypothetical protein
MTSIDAFNLPPEARRVAFGIYDSNNNTVAAIGVGDLAPDNGPLPLLTACEAVVLIERIAGVLKLQQGCRNEFGGDSNRCRGSFTELDTSLYAQTEDQH